MLTGVPWHGDRLLQIELQCARVSDLLKRARRMEQVGRHGIAAAAREQAADLLKKLELTEPANPHRPMSVRGPA